MFQPAGEQPPTAIGITIRMASKVQADMLVGVFNLLLEPRCSVRS